jgi:hypothetical protein
VSTIQLERTLVKSPPELWEELSDIERWLGDVDVSRRDPPTSLLWIGRGARGVIELEASGWGTKVRARVEMDRGLFNRLRATDEEGLDVERRLTELLDHLGSSSLKK